MNITDDSRLQITLTANAGLILKTKRHSVLVDALHDEAVVGFSTMSPMMVAAVDNMFHRRAPDAVIVTHRHPDHCSDRLVEVFRERWPMTRFVLPERHTEQISVIEFGGIKISSVGLRHDGENIEGVHLRGYLLEMDGLNILVPGDCAISEVSQLCRLVGSKNVDFAFVNFPWITLSAPRGILKERIMPRNVIAIHVPFKADDINGFRNAAFKAVSMMNNAYILSEPMQTLHL